MENNFNSHWIALDGIDAVGKTSQMQRIPALLESEDRLNVEVFSEFSDSELGDTIRAIISKRRFFALNDEKNSPVANMLLLLADLVFKMEARIKDKTKKDVYISDRGVLSLLAYEAVKIHTLTREALDKVLPRLTSIINLATANLPKPGLHVIYSADMETINRRVLNRGEGKLNESQLEFLNTIQDLLIQPNPAYPSIIIDTTNLAEAEVTALTMQAIRDKIFK